MIVLLRRVIAYEYGYGDDEPDGKGKVREVASGGGFWLTKLGEWETAENEHGLTAVSTAPGSTLLALPGRQAGHVQLVHLPPCGTPAGKARTVTASFRSPILLAHTHPLSSLTCSATGSHILTASERGTLLRVWDTARGSLEKELRRGVDRAEIWGLCFEDTVFVDPSALADAERARELARRKGGRVVGWSDKGTVHVWGDNGVSPAPKPQASLAKVLGKALALPNYFSSTASTAQYYLPRKNPHAFSGAIGAAADAAGLPSMKIGEDDREPQEREWAERYVVGWIEVDPEPEPEKDKPDRLALARKPGGIGMGTREERHSFGSDATSTRTATPSGRRADTPTQSAYTAGRRDSGSARGSNRSSSQSRAPRVTVQRKEGGSGRPSPTEPKQQPPKEHQLVVITFAGDWYRLRLPRVMQPDDEEEAKSKCELVEYRRLGVGGGGW